MDELDYQVERRIEIYKNELFVKVRFSIILLIEADDIAHRFQSNNEIRTQPNSSTDLRRSSPYSTSNPVSKKGTKSVVAC